MKSKSEVLAKLVNKRGVKITLDITGYSILELFMALEDKVKIDSETAYTLLFELKKNTNLPHKCHFHEVTLKPIRKIHLLFLDIRHLLAQSSQGSC